MKSDDQGLGEARDMSRTIEEQTESIRRAAKDDFRRVLHRLERSNQIRITQELETLSSLLAAAMTACHQSEDREQ